MTLTRNTSRAAWDATPAKMVAVCFRTCRPPHLVIILCQHVASGNQGKGKWHNLVARPLRMRKVPGSMPGFSKNFYFFAWGVVLIHQVL